MKPNVEEAQRLVRLARRDLAAYRALALHPEVSPAVPCFHAQQAVEKALKAALFCHGIVFRRTHDLTELLALLRSEAIAPPSAPALIARLGPCAVAMRYDDEVIPDLTVAEMGEIAEPVCAWAQQMLEDAMH